MRVRASDILQHAHDLAMRVRQTQGTHHLVVFLTTGSRYRDNQVANVEKCRLRKLRLELLHILYLPVTGHNDLHRRRIDLILQCCETSTQERGVDARAVVSLMIATTTESRD